MTPVAFKYIKYVYSEVTFRSSFIFAHFILDIATKIPPEVVP